MSLFCSIEKSTTGIIVNKFTRQSFGAVLSHNSTKSRSRQLQRTQQNHTSSKVRAIDDLRSWFVGALVAAGNCRGKATKHNRRYRAKRKDAQICQRYSTGSHCKNRQHSELKTTITKDDTPYDVSEFCNPELDDSQIPVWRGLLWTPIARSRENFDFRSRYVGRDIVRSQDMPKSSWSQTVPYVFQRSSIPLKTLSGQRTSRTGTISRNHGDGVCCDNFEDDKLEPETQFITTRSTSHLQNKETCKHESSPLTIEPYPNLFKPRDVQEEQTDSDAATSRAELLGLVEQYGFSTTDQLPVLELPDLQHPDKSKIGPNFAVVDKAFKAEWPEAAYVWPASGEEKHKVTALLDALESNTSDAEVVYKLYRNIPAPRIPYLHWQQRNKLFKKLGIIERKDETSMLRYLSVIDDMKACEIPLMTWQWNIALSFTGRYVAKTTDLEVHRGLQVWREMERNAGVQSNEATFNILFDMATKAGKFQLAEMIYKEMESRGIPFNRFHYVSMIHYKGLTGDGEGVRAAYKALVMANEMVDTIVLNCMIASFFNVGEPQAAQMVYARMKTMHEKKTNQVLPSRDFQTRRSVDRGLYRLAQQAKLEPDGAMTVVQEQSIVAPDSTTYNLLIKHTAISAGDLSQTTSLLDEMRLYKVPLHGGIFLSLFKGFAAHSDKMYSQWTSARLDSVWRAFLAAVENRTDGIYLGRWILVTALTAFAKTSGRARALKAFEEARPLWSPRSEEDKDHVMEALRNISEYPDDSTCI